jgi:hypothetical protein
LSLNDVPAATLKLSLINNAPIAARRKNGTLMETKEENGNKQLLGAGILSRASAASSGSFLEQLLLDQMKPANPNR